MGQRLSPTGESRERTSNSSERINRTVLDDKGRITIVCMSDALDRDLLTVKLRDRGSKFLQEAHPDVLYGEQSLVFHPLAWHAYTFPTIHDRHPRRS